MNQSKWVSRGIRLSALKDFIDHVVTDATKELDVIEARRLAGEFESFGDYEYVESVVVGRLQISSRAVAQELVNFIESELHALAHDAWLQSSQKGPKTLSDLGGNEHPSRLRMVSDLSFDQVLSLIDGYYKTSVKGLAGWDAVARLRAAVNNVKHRDGIKHYRDSTWGEDGFRFPQFEESTVRHAYDALEAVKQFLVALDEVTEKRD